MPIADNAGSSEYRPPRPRVRLRRATAGDAEALARGAVEGVAGYGAFAPRLERRRTTSGAAHTRALLGDSGFHCVVAESGGEVVGQTRCSGRTRRGGRSRIRTLGHLRNLFVAESTGGPDSRGR